MRLPAPASVPATTLSCMTVKPLHPQLLLTNTSPNVSAGSQVCLSLLQGLMPPSLPCRGMSQSLLSSWSSATWGRFCEQ